MRTHPESCGPDGLSFCGVLAQVVPREQRTMTRTQTQRFGVAAEWRATRRLYSIYAAIAREFQLGDPPCKALNEVSEQSDPDVLQRVGQWLAEMDESDRKSVV